MVEFPIDINLRDNSILKYTPRSAYETLHLLFAGVAGAAANMAVNLDFLPTAAFLISMFCLLLIGLNFHFMMFGWILSEGKAKQPEEVLKGAERELNRTQPEGRGGLKEDHQNPKWQIEIEKQQAS